MFVCLFVCFWTWSFGKGATPSPWQVNPQQLTLPVGHSKAPAPRSILLCDFRAARTVPRALQTVPLQMPRSQQGLSLVLPPPPRGPALRSGSRLADVAPNP